MKHVDPPPPPVHEGAGDAKLDEPLAKGRKKPWSKPRIIPIVDGVAETGSGPQVDPNGCLEGISYRPS